MTDENQVSLREYIERILAERDKAIILEAKQHAAVTAVLCSAAIAVVVFLLSRWK